MAWALFYCYYFNMYRYFNPNPIKDKQTGDCTVRAICAATGMSWDEAFDELCEKAKEMGEMPSSNNAWGQYLQDIGFIYRAIPNTCPFCYTAADFCADHPCGTFILGTGTHVICVRNGVILDSYDSSDKVPLYCFYRKGRK